MVQRFSYTSVQTVISKFYRDLKDLSISEIDIIEWIGEAMGFMKMAEIQEEAVAFIDVENYQCELPQGLQAIIAIARNTKEESIDECKRKVAENICDSRTIREKVCEKITTHHTSIEENIFPFINCVPLS